MLFPLEKLLQDRSPITTVWQDTNVRNALEIMIQNDFSQLPIIDRNGHLTGIISERTITRKAMAMRAVARIFTRCTANSPRATTTPAFTRTIWPRRGTFIRRMAGRIHSQPTAAEFMGRIKRHSPVGWGTSIYLIAVRVQVPVVTRIQSVNRCWLSAHSIDTMYIRET